MDGDHAFERALLVRQQDLGRQMVNLTDIEANKALVRAYTDTVFSGHQLDRAPEFLAPEVKWHGGTLGTVEG